MPDPTTQANAEFVETQRMINPEEWPAIARWLYHTAESEKAILSLGIRGDIKIDPVAQTLTIMTPKPKET